LAKTPRTWTGARTPSGLKRVRQADRRREILQPRRTAAKTFVAKALDVASHQADGATAATALAEAHSALDRAAKAGAIHPNAAARRKSRLTLKFNAATGGAHLQAARVTKTTSKAQAVKAAKSRIAASKADKAKGAQTAAGKARAALSKTARADAAAKAAASAASETTKLAAKSASTKSASTKAAASRTASKTTRASASAAKPKASAKSPARKSAAKG
jgi:ribosomal protein S20